jgi:hypothetical protein
MKRIALCIIFLAFLVLIGHTFPKVLKAETLAELFQTVAYLQGKGDVEQISIDGNKYEIYLKPPLEAQPFAYKKGLSGTGFFVRKGTNIYLITAEHVAQNLKSDVKVIIHGADDKPLIYDMADLTGTGKEQKWFYHPEADVALIQLNPNDKFKGAIKVLDTELLLASAKNFDEFNNRVLTTVGFPLSLGLSEKFSPIVKTSKAASSLFTHQRSDKKILTTFFILEDPSVQGFSGGPVYAMSQVSLGGVGFGTGKFACVGLVHGTLNDNTGGKFAAIVPTYYVIQLIENYEKSK